MNKKNIKCDRCGEEKEAKGTPMTSPSVGDDRGGIYGHHNCPDGSNELGSFFLIQEERILTQDIKK